MASAELPTLLSDEQIDEALDVLRQDLGSDPRSSFRIYQKNGLLIAMPWRETSTDVMIWTEGRWEWEDDDGRYQPLGSPESRFAHWWAMVRDFVWKFGRFDVEPDETDRTAWANDVSSWRHAKELVNVLGCDALVA